MSLGKVWLVGAGPGDAGLLTLKAKKVLERADVVIYDRLIGPGVLAMIPRTARCIDVGKRAGNHTMPQSRISELLAEEAKKGNRVVRLKGGDPFLFGRGGEEIEILRREKVPYEVVCGVTSAIAVPAYGGIPVTHRDYSSSLHIITGHKKSGEEYDIDFEALVRTKGTLVFLMGLSALPEIMQKLLEAGMSPEMPAAVLEKGTTARQRRVTATVSTLDQAAAARQIGTPAIIVVGKVCALENDFSWYENMPLGGMRVVVTRPAESSSALSEGLRELGAEVIELPTIRLEPDSGQESLKQAFHRLNQYQWIVFSSPSMVKRFFTLLKREKLDARALYGVKAAALGPGTAKALEQEGILADLLPDSFDGASLGRALSAACRSGERILVPRAAEGGNGLRKALSDREDLSVEEIPFYDTVYEAVTIPDLAAAVTDGALDCAVFASSSAVKGFVHAFPELNYSEITAACIGEKTKSAAQKYGMKTAVAKNATIDSLTELVMEIAAEKRKE